jgi:Flp pilus assembly secretin CpaC
MKRPARWISLILLTAVFLCGPHSSSYGVEDGVTSGSSTATSDDDVRTVAVGQTEWLEYDFDAKVTIGNPSVMKGERDGSNPRKIKLTPIKKGSTSVDVQDASGKVVQQIKYSIIATDLSQKVLAIRRLLYDIEGITIESVDDKIVIDGELIVPRDFDRILQVQQAYPEVLNLVTLSRISRDAIARRMQKEINDDPGGVNVTVRVINDVFFLMGKVDSSADRERAETIAQTYLPEMAASPALKEGAIVQPVKKFAIRNMIMTEEPPPPPPPKMIRVTYHFVEIGKEFLKNSVFKWAPLMSEGSGLTFGQGTTGGVASSGSFTGTITSLLPKLQSGANGGFARVLFSTVAIGEEGTKIEVLRNDNIPYISAVVNGVPVPDNVPVGISVKVTPSVISEDKIRLATELQFTAFAGAGAGGKPRTTSTSMSNTTIVKSGDSAALGGLISSDTAKDIDKDPFSSGDDSAAASSPFFTLLRSKAFRTKKTQFVVFITPKIITDASEGTADIKAKILNNSQKKRRRVVR